MAATTTSHAPTIIPHPTERGASLLTSEVWVPKPRPEVFELFGDAFQLETLTPPWLNFHVITPRPIAMAPGIKIDYRLRLHGIPIRWQSLISCWEPPFLFVDEQLRGPYRKWHHLHTFEEKDGGTLVRDEVTYRVPGGRLIDRLFVRGDLERIFAFRRAKLLELLGGD
jgi:ligand-binding SRPBCC domain-containing protein